MADWTPTTFAPSEVETTVWKKLFALREQVLPELEKARQTKVIGKASDAKVVLSGSNLSMADAKA